MPISDINDSKQLTFGYGDIEVGTGLMRPESRVGVVCFFNNTAPRPIGTKNTFKVPKVVSIEETPVRMIFEKSESVDVVIRALQDAKLKMLSGDVTAEVKR
ncbi:hypothetical protein [Alkalicoccobacillus porphyridii]|uniref:Uncharacterized protein n=1 Tax=Alkalicoccobacillus porphyridii TaxID=2597270 RepID=A0A554A0B6_9BACI|nr:hypothetical protein [Alkalicoccobacillus porphyridii]TSB47144.1 hypothetical protein FN960_09040 [Alkalicoccobacillus porphyridii]